MPFICKCGESLFLRKIDSQIEHLHGIITEPQGDPPKSVIVNVSTKRCESDTTVILKPGEHPFIKHDSVINYKDALLSLAAKLEEAVNEGHFEASETFDTTILKRIQDGLLQSKQTPKNIKTYCNKIWNPTE